MRHVVFQDQFFGDVGESAVAVVVIELVARAFQSHGAAEDGLAFPVAGGGAGGIVELRGVEVNVARDEKIQVAAAIVVDEGAAGAPAGIFVS